MKKITKLIGAGVVGTAIIGLVAYAVKKVKEVDGFDDPIPEDIFGMGGHDANFEGWEAHHAEPLGHSKHRPLGGSYEAGGVGNLFSSKGFGVFGQENAFSATDFESSFLNSGFAQADVSVSESESFEDEDDDDLDELFAWDEDDAEYEDDEDEYDFDEYEDEDEDYPVKDSAEESEDLFEDWKLSDTKLETGNEYEEDYDADKERESADTESEIDTFKLINEKSREEVIDIILSDIEYYAGMNLEGLTAVSDGELTQIYADYKIAKRL